ncbi:LysM peptidoglycan-binding domain-containing protein [Peribacillus tepidiphilus]|uniref:LysM peptidoglycan-binding domain-containing protein n=1 Tax=Peribacillus tepidiphilus TaxID=2652445 RepID=UPI001291F801|nr:LysM domain-containing protein [Peribacillus tepidiphilus]
MKKLLTFFAFCLMVYVVYYDLSVGTLPAIKPTIQPVMEASAESNKEDIIPYIEVKIKAGDTLLSILERKEGKLRAPIDQILEDFQKLNEGVKPDSLQIGKTYKIPVYKK